MRRSLILVVAVSVFVTNFSGSAFAVDEKGKSVGTVAGETTRDLQVKAAEAAKTASIETEKASKQIAQVADDTFRKLNVQLQAAMKNAQESSQQLLKQFQEEWEKFQQAYHKPAKP